MCATHHPTQLKQWKLASRLLQYIETNLKQILQDLSGLYGYLPFFFFYQVLAHGFAQSLLLDDAGSILATATSWDEIEIQEEAESGSSVTSKIRLPIQVSQCHHQSCRLEKEKELRKSFNRQLLRKSYK